MPLSRLTYGAYLIHPMTLLAFYESKLSTRAYTDLDLVGESHFICEVPAVSDSFLSVSIEIVNAFEFSSFICCLFCFMCKSLLMIFII